MDKTFPGSKSLPSNHPIGCKLLPILNHRGRLIIATINTKRCWNVSSFGCVDFFWERKYGAPALPCLNNPLNTQMLMRKNIMDQSLCMIFESINMEDLLLPLALFCHSFCHVLTQTATFKKRPVFTFCRFMCQKQNGSWFQLEHDMPSHTSSNFQWIILKDVCFLEYVWRFSGPLCSDKTFRPDSLRVEGRGKSDIDLEKQSFPRLFHFLPPSKKNMFSKKHDVQISTVFFPHPTGPTVNIGPNPPCVFCVKRLNWTCPQANNFG